MIPVVMYACPGAYYDTILVYIHSYDEERVRRIIRKKGCIIRTWYSAMPGKVFFEIREEKLKDIIRVSLRRLR